MDKSSRSKTLILWLVILVGAGGLKAVVQYTPRWLPGLILAGLLAAPVYWLSRRFGATRYLLGLLVLAALTLLFLPGELPTPPGREQIAAVSLPRNADASHLLQTNIKKIQQTILVFTTDLGRSLWLSKTQWAGVAGVIALAGLLGSRLRKALLQRCAGPAFEPAVVLLYELPDRLARYLVNELLLLAFFTLGFGLGLSWLGFPHSSDLAWLFGLAGASPLVGLPWAATLSLFFVPWHHQGALMIIGLVIILAVLWLCKHFFFNPHLRHSRPRIRRPILLAAFVTGLVFFGYPGSFLSLPFFSLCYLIAGCLQEVRHMVRPQNLIS